MPANSKSEYYKRYFPEWEKIKTVLEGELAIKLAGVQYLPKLSGQTQAEYLAYLQRGSFFNATHRTIQGLTGAIIRKEPKIEADKLILDKLAMITIDDDPIEELIRKTVEEVMGFGYCGLLVDMPNKGNTAITDPYIAFYSCFDIYNFRTAKINGEDTLIMITLAEARFTPKPDDEFETEKEDLIRCLYLDAGDGNKYKQQLWKKVKKLAATKEEWVKDGEEITPMVRGMPLTEIPFIFINSTSNSPIPTKPPSSDLADLNVKHWQLSVDYYHGLHYCAMPTPWAAGFTTKAELYIGAQKAWVTEEPQARCGYLEFTGQGIGAIEKALNKVETLMAVIGARLLEEQKKVGEAAETIKLRASGDTATLSSIVSAVERGIQRAIDIVIEWMASTGKARISMNRDFVSERLGFQDITALLQAVQAGQISQDTFLYNLQVGEILPPDRTIDKEKQLIQSEAPPPTPPGGPGDEEGNVFPQNNRRAR